MPKFKIKVVYAPEPFEYEVEIEAQDETRAACAAYNQMEALSQGNRYWGDDGKFTSEIEQLTMLCVECDEEFPASEIVDDACPACNKRPSA